MKKLFIITEEERKRILGLHENATKRQYLKEATVTGSKFKGRTIQFDNTENYAKYLFDLLISRTNDGRIVGPRINVDETEFVTAIINGIKSPDALNRVNEQLINIMTQIGQTNYAGLDKIFNDILDYNAGDKDDIERLITHLQALGYNTDQAGKLRSANFVLSPIPQQKQSTGWEKYPCVTTNPNAKKLNLKDGSIVYSIGDFYYFSNGSKINKIEKKSYPYNCQTEFPKEEANQAQKQVKQSTPCPVGDTEEVKKFQDWLDSRVSGWLPKYPDGLKKDTKRGYGMCGPNTRKAWTQYGEQYKTNPEGNVAVSSKPFTPQQGEDDVAIPDNTANKGIANPN